MATFYIKKSQVQGDCILMEGDDVNHIKNVLRFQVGDELMVYDEEGKGYQTIIQKFSEKTMELKILSFSTASSETTIAVDLYQGLPKADKMEWIIQKATELGVKKIVPVVTERVIVKLDDKNEAKKLERWKKIAKEAAGQSGRQVVPTIENARNLKNSIENLSKYDIVVVPYECEKEHSLRQVLQNLDFDVKSVAVVIGPEGGFSPADIALLQTLSNVKLVSLGPRILRTETAGMVTLAMVLYELDS